MPSKGLLSSMMPRHLDVFISSTVLDLPRHRRAVMDAVWRCDMFPIAMERDPAAAGTPVKASIRAVRQSNIYIGIFGHRYGTIPPGHSTSVTEMEYRAARKKRLPCFIFIIDDKAKVALSDISMDPEERDKLIHLKRELKDAHRVEFFKVPADLGKKVYQSLSEWKQVQSKPVRRPSMRREATDLIPALPQPYERHPQSLEHAFVGRKRELEALDIWANSAVPVLMVESVGGVGKTTLAWQWMHDSIDSNAGGWAGAVWWSFYDEEASIDAFVLHALAYVTGQSLHKVGRIPVAKRRDQLIVFLKRRRFLLVLDGLERILASYMGLNAAFLRDEDADWKLHANSCINRQDGDFLRQLCMCRPSKILITTRLKPRELLDRTRNPIEGVQALTLGGLVTADAVRLLRLLRVRGRANAMGTFVEKFGCHSLLLVILAGEISIYRPAPCDFDAWHAAVGSQLNIGDVDLKRKRHHILQHALSNLQPEHRDLLIHLSLLRAAADYEAVVAFNPFSRPSPSNLHKANESPEALLHAALSELEDRGLIQWDREHNTYDMHPLVRSYISTQVNDAERQTAYTRIGNHFSHVPPKQEKEVLDVSALHGIIEHYDALIGSSQFDEAFSLYRRRLLQTLRFHLEAYPTIVELLEPLLKVGGTPRLQSTVASVELLTELGFAYFQLDEIGKALATFQACVGQSLRGRLWSGISGGLVNYSTALLERSAFRHAEASITLGHTVATACNAHELEAVAKVRYLELYVITGRWKEAEEVYNQCTSDLRTHTSHIWKAAVEREFAWMQIYRGLDASATIKRGLQFASRGQNALGVRAMLRLKAEDALRKGHPQEAIMVCHEVIARKNRAGKLSSDILGCLARSYVELGKIKEARAAIEDALELSDAFVDAAEVYLAIGAGDSAAEMARNGYRKAWADGPEYHHWWHLQRAEEILSRLDLPKPKDMKASGETQEAPYAQDILAMLPQIRQESRARAEPVMRRLQRYRWG